MKIFNYFMILIFTCVTLHMHAAEQSHTPTPVNLGDLSVLPKVIILHILSQNIDFNAKTVDEALKPLAPFFLANKYAASLKQDLLNTPEPEVANLKEKIDLYQKLAQFEANNKKYGADYLPVDAAGRNALHIASRRGSNDDIKFLKSVLPIVNKLKLFNLINAQAGYSGSTPLHLALFDKSPNEGINSNIITQLLLDHGADANITDNRYGSPLEFILQLSDSYLTPRGRIHDLAKMLIQKTNCSTIKKIYLKTKLYGLAKKFIEENLPTNCSLE